MDLEIRFDCQEIDWQRVATILESVGMAHHLPEQHKRAFEGSHTTVFAWKDGQLIGFGRAISDGVYQAAVYDVAVSPEHQRQGIGSLIMDNIVRNIPQCNFILYAAPGKEGFYTSLGFRKMKTGMARFTKQEVMIAKGFTE